MAKERGKKKKLDKFEQYARDRLEPILGPLREIDPGGGPASLHDFEADVPGIAAIEVTSEVVPAEQELEVSARRRFSSLTLPGSGRRWLVTPASGARVNVMKSGDLRLLMHDLEADGRWSVHCQGDYLDPFVQRLRALRIDSIFSWAAGARKETVMAGSRVYGGWGWDGAATGAWLEDFLASPLGMNKLGKLGRARATERHLVIMLDPRSPAGLCMPVGLTGVQEPGAADTVMPSFDPPAPLTHMWLMPMVSAWLGLSWSRRCGWAILDGRAPVLQG